MRIEEISFKLKDGRDAILRSPKEDDAEAVLNCWVTIAKETDFILNYPEECNKYTVEGEKAFLRQKNESPYDAMILCIVDGKLAGMCEINFYSRLKMKHRANVSIAQTKEFWNQGIGTKMFEEMIRIANKREDVQQLELEYIEGNDRARALYEKMGFKVTGVRPNAILLKDGTLLSEYTMIKELN